MLQLTSFSSSSSAEVVDAHDRPLLVMHAADILAQGLRHRRVILLPRCGGRVLLFRREGLWTFPGAPVAAGRSRAEQALLLAEEAGLEDCPIRLLSGPDPCLEMGNALLSVFVAGLSPSRALTFADGDALSLDANEVAGVLAATPDLLSPLVRPLAPLLFLPARRE